MAGQRVRKNGSALGSICGEAGVAFRAKKGGMQGDDGDAICACNSAGDSGLADEAMTGEYEVEKEVHKALWHAIIVMIVG